MIRYEVWDQKEAEKNVSSRFLKAKSYHEKFHGGWTAKENILFKNISAEDSPDRRRFSRIAALFGGSTESEADSRISINFAYKYVRFIHSQMVANPPVVIPRPTSYDFSDQRAARAADHIATHLRREYDVTAQVSDACLLTLCHGTGFVKTENDPYRGEPLEVNRETQELTMTGDFDVRAVSVWDVMLDPAASRWKDLRYLFYRHVMSTEEAKMKFPKYKDQIEKYKKKSDPGRFWDVDDSGEELDIVEVWEYIEAGLPQNGLLGRRMFVLGDGKPVSNVEVSPYPEAKIPFHVLTDVDVPGSIYGKTFVDYIARLQVVINQLDSVLLENVQNHGVIRMVVYDAAEGGENPVSGDSVDVINVRGTAAQKPDFVNPPALMADFHNLRAQLVDGMEQLAGVNESMFGKQSREMSGFSMQTAIDAGNMVRKGLFEKYKKLVENIYDYLFLLVNQHWTTKHKVLVVGKENSYDVKYYSNEDISKGFVLDLEYGESFSIDPASRREEIMQVAPLLKEAGIPAATILGMLRFNNISGLFDRIEAAKQRQLEIFDEMKAAFFETKTVVKIPVEPMQEHQGMLQAAYDYINTKEFDVLDYRLKQAIKDHIKDREEMAAKEAAPQAAPGAPAAPAEGAPSALPALLGAVGGLPPGQ